MVDSRRNSRRENSVQDRGSGSAQMNQARTGRVGGERILATGGVRGLGAACARRLSDEGARVIIADLLDDAGERLAQEIGGHYRRLDRKSTRLNSRHTD